MKFSSTRAIRLLRQIIGRASEIPYNLLTQGMFLKLVMTVLPLVPRTSQNGVILLGWKN
jgi:hypothetical protein